MTTTLLRDQPADTNMALPDEQDESKVRLPVGGYLFTPPENTVDSFSHGDEAQAIEEWRKTTLRPIVQTPPASPEFKDTHTLPSLTTATGFQAHDSPLFPEQTQSNRTRPQLPLFEKELSQSPSPTRSTIPVHSPASNTTTPVPQRSRSGTFPFNLNISTGQEALRYYYARMEELKAGRSRELPPPKKSSSLDLDQESRRQLQSLNRVAKSRPAGRTVAKPKAATPASPAQNSPPKQRRTPKVKTTMDDFYGTAFPQKEAPTKHKRAPPSKKVEGENANWTELPDYAPPTSDLDENNRVLKVTWHGHKLLPNPDSPDRQYLHEQEIEVAQTLRLDPAVYLTNKRKIFQARVQALRDGKNFTKTAAQSACKIDVNKASQLWEAYHKVDWFNPDWFQQYL